MTGSITRNVHRHAEQLVQYVLGVPVPARILAHILEDKFKRSAVQAVASQDLPQDVVETVLREVVGQKYEQRVPTGDIYDEVIWLLRFSVRCHIS